MPPNVRRFLPIILIAFFLLVLLPALFRKNTTKGPTAATLSQQTTAAMNLVDRAELAYKAAKGSYSEHLTDLLALSPKLGADLVDGVAVQLDISTDGQGYFGEVGSNVLTFVRARQGAKLTTHGCLVVKSGSGVACPVTAAKTAGSGTTTAGTTTTG
jgi:hypothetical protein